jgi:KTSC domain
MGNPIRPTNSQAKMLSKSELAARTGGIVSPNSDVIYDRRTSQGRAAGRVFHDQLNDLDVTTGLQSAGQYYYGEQGGYGQDTTPGTSENLPTFVEYDIPTSSTNYSRPRTVAAGYDPAQEMLTVVFRDGTVYNYYEVTQNEWMAFYASFSKGKHWLNPKNSNQAYDGVFLDRPRGDADVSKLDPRILEAVYRVARTAQILQTKKVRTKFESRPATAKVGKKYQGQNPSKGGKNPFQPRGNSPTIYN